MTQSYAARGSSPWSDNPTFGGGCCGRWPGCPTRDPAFAVVREVTYEPLALLMARSGIFAAEEGVSGSQANGSAGWNWAETSPP